MTHPPRSTSHQLLGLLGWLALSFSAAAAGGFASANAGSFYGALSQPAWAPPAWLFGPVWSVLYLGMGVAAWLVWRLHGWRGARAALTLFVLQLVANGLWTWLFFVWHLGAVSLMEIALLWVLIAWTVIAFWRLHRVAACLLLPYLAWVSFATALTYSLWQRNPQVLGVGLGLG